MHMKPTLAIDDPPEQKTVSAEHGAVPTCGRICGCTHTFARKFENNRRTCGRICGCNRTFARKFIWHRLYFHIHTKRDAPVQGASPQADKSFKNNLRIQTMSVIVKSVSLAVDPQRSCYHGTCNRIQVIPVFSAL